MRGGVLRNEMGFSWSCDDNSIQGARLTSSSVFSCVSLEHLICFCIPIIGPFMTLLQSKSREVRGLLTRINNAI